MIDSHVSMLWQSWIPIFQQPLGYGYPPSHQLRVKNGGVLFRLGSQGICPKSETCPTNRSIHIYIYIDIGLRSSLSSDCKSVRWQYCCSRALFSNTSLLRPYSTSGLPSSGLPSSLPSLLPHSLTYLPPNNANCGQCETQSKCSMVPWLIIISHYIPLKTPLLPIKKPCSSHHQPVCFITMEIVIVKHPAIPSPWAVIN